MQGDGLLWDAEGLGHQLHARVRVLRGGPDLQFAVFPVSGAVLGLQRGMSQEGVGVGRVHRLDGSRKTRGDVAVGADGAQGRGLGEANRLGVIAHRGLICRGMIRPPYVQLLATLLGLPPAVGDDADTGQQSGQFRSALHDESVAHALDRSGSVQIASGDAGAEHRRLLKGRVDHAGQDNVDAEQRLARDNCRRIHLRLERPDDFVILGVLQRQAGERRGRHGCGLGGKSAIGRLATGRLVRDHSRGSGALGCGDAPILSGGCHQHSAASGPDLSQLVPVDRRGHAAARELEAVQGIVRISLLRAHLAPLNVQLLSDQHGK